MPKPREISRSKQLLVEGRDAEAFFYPFLESMGIADIQIQNYGGIGELAAFLKQFVLSFQYRRLPVVSVGIVRDAEQNAGDAFKSVCGALAKANLPVPSRPLIPTRRQPKVCVFILPDEKSSGMIETLLLRAVSDEPVFECVNEYLDCIVRMTGMVPKPADKARLLTFLASRPDIKPLTGYAARAGYLKFESPVYDHLKKFILSL
jgi:hypothetical protein